MLSRSLHMARVESVKYATSALGCRPNTSGVCRSGMSSMAAMCSALPLSCGILYKSISVRAARWLTLAPT